MARFPVDVRIADAKRALERLGFSVVREGAHISMVRQNPDGTRTPLTIPAHRRLKSSTLRAVLTQAGIPRDDFITALRG